MEKTFTGAVAVLDVLGFGSRGAQLPAAEARRQLLDPLIYSVFEAELELGKYFSHADIPARLQYLYFADTAAVVLPLLPRGKLSVPGTAVGHLAQLCSFVVTRCIWNNVAIRGAISFGEVLFSEFPAYLLGPAAFEAHREERRQEWAGVVICRSAEALVVEAESQEFCRWSVPMKKGVTESRLVVNWPRRSSGPSTKRWGPKAEVVASPSPNWDACFMGSEEDLAGKRENTRAFFEFQDAAYPNRFWSMEMERPIVVTDLERVARYRRPPIRDNDERLQIGG